MKLFIFISIALASIKIAHNETEYLIFNTSRLTFILATFMCIRHGGKLVEIADENEQIYLSSLISHPVYIGSAPRFKSGSFLLFPDGQVERNEISI